MEYIPDSTHRPADERLEERGARINEYQIRANLVPVNENDTSHLAKTFKLEPDELHAALRAGTYLLTTDAVSLDPSVSYKEEETERSLPPAAGSLKVSIGEQPMNEIGLYLDRAKVEELLGRPLADPPQFDIQNDSGARYTAGVYLANHDQTILKVNTELEQFPHTGNLAAVAIMSGETAVAVLAIDTEAPDFRYPDSLEFGGIYIRGLDTPNFYPDEQMEALVADAGSAVEQANQFLRISPDIAPKPQLILSATRNDHGASYWALPDSQNEDADGTIYVAGSRLLRRIENLAPPQRQRVIRHEYMHALDWWLGDGTDYFSELHEGEIAGQINQILTGKPGTPEPDEFDPNPLWHDRHLIEPGFSEGTVMGQDLGHASSNIRELVASTLNSLADPDYPKAFDNQLARYRDLSESDIAKYKECHALIRALVTSRINEKIAPQSHK